MRIMRVWVALAVLALAGGLAAASMGAAGTQTPPPRETPPSVVRVSMGQAVKMVEARYQARVVRADTRRQGGQVIYVMRLLDRHGRVFTVRVDAASGTIL